ncbi:MAG: DinB family protein [Dehalococcoidia bacterium]|nr:DinB family protein [Dehalococcoidia bacterium]
MARIDFVTGNAQRYLPAVGALAEVPDRLERLLAAHPAAELRHAPAAGEWSPARIMGHLVAYARHSRSRIHRMVWMTDPVFAPFDDEQEAEANAWEAQSGAALLEALTAAIAETVEELKDLPDASWGRAGIHPVDGRRSIHQQVLMGMDHYAEHCDQLERAVAR